MKLRSSKLEFVFEVLVESLSDVPRLQGFIQCKLRLLGSGTPLRKPFRESHKVCTPMTKIENHQAQFNSRHSFTVQMSTNNKAVLKSQIMRVSVRLSDTTNLRKKLGYSDIDLAELSPGDNTRKPLLTGYKSNKRERQDNSRIILKINMRLNRGDPMSFIPAGAEYNSYNGSRNVIKDLLNPNPHLEAGTLNSQLTASEGGAHSRNPSTMENLGPNTFELFHQTGHSRHISLSHHESASAMSTLRSSNMDTMTSTGNMAASGNPTTTLNLREHPYSVSSGGALPAAASGGTSKRLLVSDEGDCLAPTRLDNQTLVDNLFKSFSSDAAVASKP